MIMSFEIIRFTLERGKRVEFNETSSIRSISTTFLATIRGKNPVWQQLDVEIPGHYQNAF